MAFCSIKPCGRFSFSVSPSFLLSAVWPIVLITLLHWNVFPLFFSCFPKGHFQAEAALQLSKQFMQRSPLRAGEKKNLCCLNKWGSNQCGSCVITAAVLLEHGQSCSVSCTRAFRGNWGVFSLHALQNEVSMAKRKIRLFAKMNTPRKFPKGSTVCTKA